MRIRPSDVELASKQDICKSPTHKHKKVSKKKKRQAPKQRRWKFPDSSKDEKEEPEENQLNSEAQAQFGIQSNGGEGDRCGLSQKATESTEIIAPEQQKVDIYPSKRT